jgi:hypothetical protein
VFKLHNSGFITVIPNYPNNSAVRQTLQHMLFPYVPNIKTGKQLVFLKKTGKQLEPITEGDEARPYRGALT